MDVPIPILEAEISRAASASAKARVALARGEDVDVMGPLARMRRASSRETWLELSESKDPLAASLRPWVAALTLDRVLWRDEVRLASAWRAPSIQVEAPGLGAFVASPRDLLHRVLGEQERGRRHILADALARGATAARDAARILAERRREATRLLGADGDALEIPIAPSTSITSIATRVVHETNAIARAEHETWDDALAASVARSAGEGWPARLGARWLFELFHKGPLTEGLRIDLAPLPEPLGAASFARALAMLGAAIAEGDGPKSAPLGLTRSPFDLRRARRAALFASLAIDPVFHARALGLGRDRARDQARHVARSLVISLRLDAARVLLRGALTEPSRVLASRFEERTFEAIGAPIPASLAGLVPRLGPRDPTRLAGALLAMRDRRMLVERFDEDWFRSPHAMHAIREEDANVPPSLTTTDEALGAGLGEVLRTLTDLG